MIVLDFVGRDADSDALLFTDEGGVEYTAALTDALMAAVMRGATIEGLEEAPRRPLSPGQIQALLREGMSAAQVAEQTGTDLERVRRYEGPVLAEIARAIDSTRTSRVGTDRDAPTVGDLVVDRLAERGVDTDALDWRAARRGTTWDVTVAFIENGVEKLATWSLGEPGNVAVAADDAARELTENVRVPEPVRALFPPVHPSTIEPLDAASEGLLDRQEQLLQRLNAARGRRQPVMLGFDGMVDEEPEGTDGSLQREETVVEVRVTEPDLDVSEAVDLEGVAESSSGEDEQDSHVLSADDTLTDEAGGDESSADAVDEYRGAQPTKAEEAAEVPRKRGRTPVPSWDEIVFGSRGD